MGYGPSTIVSALQSAVPLGRSTRIADSAVCLTERIDNQYPPRCSYQRTNMATEQQIDRRGIGRRRIVLLASRSRELVLAVASINSRYARRIPAHSRR